LIKSGGTAYFLDSAAEEASALGLRLIGTDANFHRLQRNQIKPHKAFLGKGIAVLEGSTSARWSRAITF
jgi:hypothetical protein